MFNKKHVTHTWENTNTDTHTPAYDLQKLVVPERWRRDTEIERKTITDYCRFKTAQTGKLRKRSRAKTWDEGKKDGMRAIRQGWRKGEWVQCPGQAFNTGERNETRGPKKNRNAWPHTLSIFLFPSLHNKKHTSWDRKSPTITTNRCGHHSQFKLLKKNMNALTI